MTALDQIVDPELRRYYAEQVTAIYRDAYRVQGLKAFESSRRAAALHEAGHCVAFALTADYVRWWPASKVRIWREPLPESLHGLTVWLGKTDVSPKAPPIHVHPSDGHGTAIYATRAVSGVASELLFDGVDFRLGSSADELLIAGGCARNLATLHWGCEPEQAFSMLLGGTAALLKTNSAIVQNLACSLERRRKLQGRELEALLRKVCQQPPVR